MKKLMIIAIAIIITLMNNNESKGEIKQPTITPLGNGSVLWTIWHGPKKQLDQYSFECKGAQNAVCMEIIYKEPETGGSGNIGFTGIIPSGTRIHIWNNWETTPSGITNVVLAENWNINSNIEPNYITDLSSSVINDYSIFLNTPILP